MPQTRRSYTYMNIIIWQVHLRFYAQLSDVPSATKSASAVHGIYRPSVLQSCFVFDSSAVQICVHRPDVATEVLYGFPHSLQTMTEITSNKATT